MYGCPHERVRKNDRTAFRYPGIPEGGWRDEIEADLKAQLQAGGTLCGVRSDGAYVARTIDGERVLGMPDR